MVSRELLLKILRFHNIGPNFLDLLPAFRMVDELSEKGNSLWSVLKASQGEIGTIVSRAGPKKVLTLRQSSVITSSTWRRMIIFMVKNGLRGRSACMIDLAVTARLS